MRALAGVALRTLLQHTHKSEDMVTQALMFADILWALHAIRVKHVHTSTCDMVCDGTLCAAQLEEAINAMADVYESFTAGRTLLLEVLSRDLSDEDAFHGPLSVFSVR